MQKFKIELENGEVKEVETEQVLIISKSDEGELQVIAGCNLKFIMDIIGNDVLDELLKRHISAAAEDMFSNR